MALALVRSIASRVRRFVDGSEGDRVDGAPPPSVDPVVIAADRRIRERGLLEFSRVIDQMAADPTYAPDPLDIVEAGVPELEADWDTIDLPVVHHGSDG